MIQQCTVIVTWVEDWGKLHLVEMVDVNEELRSRGQTFQPELLKHLYHHFKQQDEYSIDILTDRGEPLSSLYINANYQRSQSFDCTIYLQAHSEQDADSVLFRLKYLLKQWRGLRSLEPTERVSDSWQRA